MGIVEQDVCIIGGGITAAMVAKQLLELRPHLSIAVVEAGKRLFDLDRRMEDRRRSIVYGENPWPGDFIPDQSAAGVISRTMAVGGSALHWGGTCNRFSEEDLRLKSMFGLYTDWPLEWRDLEQHYCEAERRLGVSGEPSPLPEDWRSEPYPMAAMTPTHNLLELKNGARKAAFPFGARRKQRTQSLMMDGQSASAATPVTSAHRSAILAGFYLQAIIKK